jgi:hypothetical protein
MMMRRNELEPAKKKKGPVTKVMPMFVTMFHIIHDSVSNEPISYHV